MLWYNNYLTKMAPAVLAHPGARATRGVLVTEHRIARFARPSSSTRQHRYDYPFLKLLEQHFGIGQYSLGRSSRGPAKRY